MTRVYSRTVEHVSDDLASIIGIMQALISVFLDDGDKLRCINAGNARINVLIRSPLYYVCVSSWGEPESVVSFKPIFSLCLSHTLEARRAHISNIYTCKC
jgi:hypothetical protein